MKKILFIAAHRLDRSPSQRYRFEQYFSYFREQGWICDLSPLISAEDDQFFYKPGNFFRKIGVLVRSIQTRLRDVKNADNYDIVFIQREAFMLGSVYFEKQLSMSKAKIVFDFDDAIWHMDVSEGNKKFKFLKDPSKTGRIIALSDIVFAGNRYLADYAKQVNTNVVIIPTTIDTNKHCRRKPYEASDKICIGWSGSNTTIKHFEYAINFLKRIKEKYGDKVYFKVMGEPAYKNPELGIQGIPWTSDTEVEVLSSFDIGIMPLPDDEWAKGKCGLKGLSYMALEIPTILSPVGVNTEIIEDGVNGFLATSDEEWVEKLSLLIESEALRRELGKKARKTIVDRYSVESQKDVYIKYFKQLTGK
ncbi:MAG: glycosyltransferase family 4 protein [Flavobacteriales bacterium]